MDEAALLRFLMDASRRGYAAGGSAVKVREADHSTTIVLEHGEWRFHDNYFGGEPYGGRADPVERARRPDPVGSAYAALRRPECLT